MFTRLEKPGSHEVKMKKSTIIIRLIDVVFILLLGFLNISNIVNKKQIKLPPKSGTKDNVEKETEILPIEVLVMPGDTIIAGIDPFAKETSLIEKGQLYCYYLVNENYDQFYFRMLDKLEDHLKKAHSAYDSVVVVVKPDPNSMIQGTINLIDICRKYNFKRKFKYKEERN